MNIYLIRHGRQNSKLCNVDVELSPEGREQADLVGKRLQTYHIDVVYSSQLIRAKETADIINKYLNKPRVIEERIQEANFGTMTGMTNEAIDEKYGDYLAQRSAMTTDMTYPDGENCQMVYERAKAGLDDIVKDSLEKGYENICIVTHGGVLRALVTGIMGAPYKNWLAVGRQIENCSISQLLYDEKSKTYIIELWENNADRNDGFGQIKEDDIKDLGQAIKKAKEIFETTECVSVEVQRYIDREPLYFRDKVNEKYFHIEENLIQEEELDEPVS